MAYDCDAEDILKPLVFRLHDSVPEAVREVLLERGWSEFDEQEQNETDWNLYWQNSPFRMTDHCSIKPWQRLNHYPETVRITRKDYLARHLKRMKGIYGPSLYEFSPVAFIMPNDYVKFIAEYTKERQSPGRKPSYWICKPVDLSRGRGILIFQDIKDLVYDCMVIVQKYISNPLLISGYKWDLRLYVCVTSFCPLTIYTYEEGLVRFATEKFDLSSLDNVYAHLTNTSINKFGASYKKNKEGIGRGCKWTISKFRSYLRSHEVDDLLLWQRINNIIILTLLAITPSVPLTSNCFELFGFDILIDDKFKPWLLEVNYSPALRLDCSIDTTVKKRLLHDIIELLNYKQIDTLRENKGASTKSSYAGRTHVPLATQGENVTNDVPNFLASRQESECTATSAVQSLLEVTAGSFKKEAIVMGKMARAHPRKTLTSQLRERMNRPKTSSQSKAASKSKQLPGARHPPHASVQVTHCLPATELCNYKLTIPPYFLSAKDKKPFPRVGDFILIFPFNDAVLEASRNGIDVKSIIQEIHKLMNKQLPPGQQKVKNRKDYLTFR
ncbi:probable tubulin polyglutamylase TTLL2 [Emydura macquarii macquarii]|uniref:probable tubulin polyglutamylase TTLL2 n=1 Tax=Emydura macquarii macquarii TaxID=1129001 RepID=UPI00352A0A78